MHKLISLIERFRRDESGAFAMIFAVIAVVIIAMSGAVVDFTGVQQARTRAQVALDSAALALQPTIYNTGVTAATIQPLAQALLIQSLADAGTTWKSCVTTSYKAPCATVATPVIDITNGQLTLNAQIEVGTNFVSLVGVPKIPSQITAVATRKKLNLEVALVLDNSGSMDYSIGYTKHVNGIATRMDTLHSAADCATNILFYGVTTCTASTTGLTVAANVKVALVPFNDEVNVGVGNAGAAWLDRSGAKSSTWPDDNFDNSEGSVSPYVGTIDRVTLFNSIKDKNGNALSWGGCVEARINDGANKQYDTDDTTPDPTQTDTSTMFTPMFAPDEPDSSSVFQNDYITDTPAACNQTGACAQSSTAKVTYSDVTTIIVAKGTATVKKNSNGSTVSTTNITSTFTTGPVSGTASTGSATNASPTVTAANGDTRTASGVCSCTGQTLKTDNTTPGSASTNGSLSKSGPSNSSSSIPGDTTQNNTPVNGQTTTNHYTSATKEVDTQPMKYTATRAWTCNAPYAPWAIGASGSTGGLTQRVMQERLCKYTGSQMTSAVSTGFGPNADCPASAIQPLTATPGTVTTAIDAMGPAGNTNIQEGAAWGFRVLSPGEPFTQGLPYDQATSKVMIIMTDGENTYTADDARNETPNMNGADLYAAYAYPWDNDKAATGNPTRGRMGTVDWSSANFATEINTRLAKTCVNAKKAGLTIYTIGLYTVNTSDPTGNTKLLTDCATDATKAYFPNSATDLQNAFVAIANELAALRLSK